MKIKLKPTDGLGPLEIKKIRSALRLTWQRSHARRLVVKRCTRQNGFYYCELCSIRTPLLKVDHIRPAGQVNGGYIQRLFTPSKNLQGLCIKCHNAKTKEERKALKASKASLVYTALKGAEDFY